MPHAEETMSSKPLVNGETPSSQTINHITSYPVVSESYDTIKKNPYGKTGIQYMESGYDSVVKPVLPYAEKPYGYVAPYVAKVDELAAHGLDKVDATFPIITKDSETIKSTVWQYAMYPFVTADELKNWALETYNQEYKKCGGDGIVAGGKAAITTSLVLTSQSLDWLSKLLSEKKAEAKVAAKDAKETMQTKANQVGAAVKDKTKN